MLTVGWETVLCVLAALATATVMQALGWTNQTSAQILGFIIVVGCSAFAGIFGFDTIMRVQTIITWLTAILTIIYLALTIPSINWENISSMPFGISCSSNWRNCDANSRFRFRMGKCGCRLFALFTSSSFN